MTIGGFKGDTRDVPPQLEPILYIMQYFGEK